MLWTFRAYPLRFWIPRTWRSLSACPSRRFPRITSQHVRPYRAPEAPHVPSFREELAKTEVEMLGENTRIPPTVSNQILFFLVGSILAFGAAARWTKEDTLYWTNKISESSWRICYGCRQTARWLPRDTSTWFSLALPQAVKRHRSAPLRCRASHRGATGAHCPLLAVAEAPLSLNAPNSTSLHPPSTVFFARRPTTMNDGAPVVTPASTLRLALPQAVERKRSAARLFSTVEGHAR
ncbi:hypothetical protein BKA93DRAFT_753381 [Sparassis latifolia]